MRRLLAIFLVLSLVLGQALTAGARVASMSIVKEKEMGRKAYQQVIAQMPIIEDPDSVEYIRALGAKLVNQLESHTFDYTFNMIASPDVNAFAIPGGYIFIYLGLINEFDNEAQLASVVAHEIGHVTERHLASRMDRSAPSNIASLAGMLAGILLGVAAGSAELGQAITLGTMAGNVQNQLAFSREDEAQADYVGYKLITSLGYDPQEMVNGFKKIYRLETMMSPQVATYLRTHPQSPERMDAITNLMRRNPPKVTPHSNRDFRRIKTRLVALYNPIQQAEETFMRQASQEPHSPLPRYGMALVMLRQHNYPKALELLESLGEGFDDNPYVEREKAVCYLGMGRLDKAEPLFQAVLRKRPKDKSAMQDLGTIYLSQNRLTEAERTYQRMLKLDDDDPEAHYQLGVTLGRQGRTGLASYYLGTAFTQRHNMRMAKYHLNKARQSGELNYTQKKKVDELLKDMEKPGPDGDKDKDEDKDRNPEERGPSS
jgi:predicted Zn-dependent protease